uniref:Uncharacterized protein n=1 Tax=Arion vulgaris TaxID=1028688 RepID=A0A0B6Y812_9EUPU
MFRWFFFCDTGHKIAGNGLETSRDDPCDQKRLLCWAVLCTYVWANISHTVLHFFLLVVSTVSLSLLVNFLTKGCHGLTEITKGTCHLALVIGLLSAVTTVTCQPLYLRYELFVKKNGVKRI